MKSDRWTVIVIKLPASVSYPSPEVVKDNIILFGGADACGVGVKDKVWVVGGFDVNSCLDSVQIHNTVT